MEESEGEAGDAREPIYFSFRSGYTSLSVYGAPFYLAAGLRWFFLGDRVFGCGRVGGERSLRGFWSCEDIGGGDPKNEFIASESRHYR